MLLAPAGILRTMWLLHDAKFQIQSNVLRKVDFLQALVTKSPVSKRKTKQSKKLKARGGVHKTSLQVLDNPVASLF